MAVRKVKVWNDNTAPYSEHFRDNMLTIPSKGFITMEEPEAALFMGQFTPPLRDGHGRDKNPKMLRVEVVDLSSFETPTNHVCMACKKDFETSTLLTSHIAENHKEAMLDDEARQSVSKPRKA